MSGSECPHLEDPTGYRCSTIGVALSWERIETGIRSMTQNWQSAIQAHADKHPQSPTRKTGLKQRVQRTVDKRPKSLITQ